ncbi:MAG TPA: DUF4153 domain-containing protein [bacterium]|jgi:hypothetical protein|nr:DUF4153 domain-containing protein [bacterium]
MKLPSIDYVAGEARRAFDRFPYVLISAILSAIVALYLVEDTQEVQQELIKLLLVLSLGIPLFFSMALYSEKPLKTFRPPRWAFLLGVAAFLTILYFVLLNSSGTVPYFRYAQITLAVHLFVAFAPFLSKGEVNGFWQLNKNIFLRFWLSALYASVFFIGLTLAIAAVDYLFALKLDGKIYERLWIFTAYVFMTWHFLAGMPQDIDQLDNTTDYPKGLKVFTQYMLVPLATLYFLILYVYMGKILLNGVWPKGWVGWLVSDASVLGVLTLLLLYPAQEKTDTWIKIYAKGFYVAVIPLLGMLFAAIGQRLGQYGITENRYFLFILGLWLLGIALYFIFVRTHSIKTIPISLFLLVAISSFGPWGAYSVSQSSQSQRLTVLLTKNHLWNGVKLLKSTQKLSFEDQKQLSDIVEYLANTHGVNAFSQWTHQDLKGVADQSAGYERSEKVTQAFLSEIGVEYVNRWTNSSGDRPLYYEAKIGEINVSGYEHLVDINGFGAGSGITSYHLVSSGHGNTLEVQNGKSLVCQISLNDFMKNISDLKEKYNVPQETLSLTGTQGNVRVKIYFRTLSLQIQQDGSRLITGASALLLIHQP